MPDFFHWCLSGKNELPNLPTRTTTQFFRSAQEDMGHRFAEAIWSSDCNSTSSRFAWNFSWPIAPVRGQTHRPCADKGYCTRFHDTGSAVAAVPSTNKTEGSWVLPKLWHLVVNGTRIVSSAAFIQGPSTSISPTTAALMGPIACSKTLAAYGSSSSVAVLFESRGQKIGYPELVRLAQGASASSTFLDPDDPRFVNPEDMPAAIREFLPGKPGNGRLNPMAQWFAAFLESLALIISKRPRKARTNRWQTSGNDSHCRWRLAQCLIKPVYSRCLQPPSTGQAQSRRLCSAIY
jgi:hypothetical protein